MPLRHMARRLRVPATTALQRASSPRVSPPTGPRLHASRSPQLQAGEANGAANGIKDLDKLNTEAMLELEEVAKAVKNLPKACLLSVAAASMLVSGTLAYAFGAFSRNNRYKW